MCDHMVPKHIQKQPIAFTTYLKTKNIQYKNQLLTLSQNEPYTYLGIRLVVSLQWNIKKETMTTKL